MTFSKTLVLWPICFFAVLSPSRGETVTILAAKDSTLYEYDPSDADSTLHSNGAGDFFSAGRNRERSLIRRGLIQFDFFNMPVGAVVVPGSVALTLEVVDSPRRDTSGEDREFWLLPVVREWGEGSSEANAGVSGAGSGAPAMRGDATWLHAIYDPDHHDPRRPDVSVSGHWPQPGVLGNGPIDPTTLGSPSGAVPAAPYLGPVTFVADSLESDINRWLANPGENFGWLVMGDERIGDADRSSNRGFASREHPDSPPTLKFEYLIEELLGDLNNDRTIEAVDIDLLAEAIRSGNGSSQFDLNGDFVVDLADHMFLVEEIIGTLIGDANLNREIEFQDFLMLSRNFGQAGGWSAGDFDGSGDVHFNDFLSLSQNFGRTSTTMATVPESSGLTLLLGLYFLSLFHGHRIFNL